MYERHSNDDRTDAPTVRESTTDAAVLHALDAVPSMPPAELCRALDADPTTVDRCCHRLQHAGYLRARTDGSYSITASGERRLRTLLRTRPMGTD